MECSRGGTLGVDASWSLSFATASAAANAAAAWTGVDVGVDAGVWAAMLSLDSWAEKEELFDFPTLERQDSTAVTDAGDWGLAREDPAQAAWAAAMATRRSELLRMAAAAATGLEATMGWARTSVSKCEFACVCVYMCKDGARRVRRRACVCCEHAGVLAPVSLIVHVYK